MSDFVLQVDNNLNLDNVDHNNGAGAADKTLAVEEFHVAEEAAGEWHWRKPM